MSFNRPVASGTGHFFQILPSRSGFIHFDIAQVSDTPPPIPAPQEVGGMVVPTLDEEIYDHTFASHDVSCVLELPAKISQVHLNDLLWLL